MSLFREAPASVCILRLSAIGDVCNTLSVVQAIQTQWPSTKITWIASTLEAQLLKGASEGIEVITFDKKKGAAGYLATWRQLKGRRFSALLHMQTAIRASFLTLGIKADYTLGFDAKRSQDLQHLFTNVKVPSPEKPHVLDGLKAFATTLGIPEFTPTWHIPHSEADIEWAATLTKEPTVIIVPGASKTYKNWTPEGYIGLSQHILNQNYRVILAGSPAPSEIELAAEIVHSVPEVTNLVGKTSLDQLFALLKLADIVVSPDTGPAHMANAVATPVLGLYAHHNPMRTGPYNYLNYVVSCYDKCIEKETGKPAHSLPWRSRVKDPLAMGHIHVKDTINMFNRIVSETNK